MTQYTPAPWAELVLEENGLMTEGDLMALPDDGWLYELVQGRLVRMAPTGIDHGRILDSLLAALRSFVLGNHLGIVTPPETGFRVTRPGEADTVLAPDIAFIPAERVPPRGSREAERYAQAAPELVFEVASPSQHRPELAAKMRLWLAAGVRLGWVAWPRLKQVDLWLPGRDTPAATLRVEDELDGMDVLPGFTFPVRKLFE